MKHPIFVFKLMVKVDSVRDVLNNVASYFFYKNMNLLPDNFESFFSFRRQLVKFY